MSEIEVVFAGEVDHGKSSLVGRLIHECGLLSDSRLRAIARASDDRGRVFEWAFVTDAFLDERDRNITVDHCEVSLRIRNRRWVIVDTPGHHEFAEKLLAGASRARFAVVVVDPTKNVVPWFHINVLKVTGIRDVIIALSKADLGHSTLPLGLKEGLEGKGFTVHSVVSVSARSGEGLPALIDAIEDVNGKVVRPTSPTLLIQSADVGLTKGWATGLVRAGNFVRLADGQEIEVQHFVQWPKESVLSQAQGAVVFDTSDAVERGDVLVPVPFKPRPFHLALFMLDDHLVPPLEVACGPVRRTVKNFEILRCLELEGLTETTLGKGVLVIIEAQELQWPADDVELSRLLVFSGKRLVARAVVVETSFFGSSWAPKNSECVGEPESNEAYPQRVPG